MVVALAESTEPKLSIAPPTSAENAFPVLKQRITDTPPNVTKCHSSMLSGHSWADKEEVTLLSQGWRSGSTYAWFTRHLGHSRRHPEAADTNPGSRVGCRTSRRRSKRSLLGTIWCSAMGQPIRERRLMALRCRRAGAVHSINCGQNRVTCRFARSCLYPTEPTEQPVLGISWRAFELESPQSAARHRDL